MDAILKCKELEYSFPSDISKAAKQFEDISLNCAIKGFVGVIDGFLLKINPPSNKKVGNVKYFSQVITKDME